ncbi:MAG TPA: hypothetical protein VN213_02690 [Solirubrobacteraceae bacterium]|nr:hypothetical protein [Solirubrobacteraceae bacterium]
MAGPGRAAPAWAVASGLLGIAIAVVGDAERTGELLAWIGPLTLVLAVRAI